MEESPGPRQVVVRSRAPVGPDEALRSPFPLGLDRRNLRVRGQLQIRSFRAHREVPGYRVRGAPGDPVLHDPDPRVGPRPGPGAKRAAAEGGWFPDLLRVPCLLRGVVRQPDDGAAETGPPGVCWAVRAEPRC